MTHTYTQAETNHVNGVANKMAARVAECELFAALEPQLDWQGRIEHFELLLQALETRLAIAAAQGFTPQPPKPRRMYY